MSRAYYPGSEIHPALAEDHGMQLTPREFDKLIIHMLADVALKRNAKGIKLNYPEAVAVISSATALDGARAGKTIEEVTHEARSVLTKADVMDGVADLIPPPGRRHGDRKGSAMPRPLKKIPPPGRGD